MTASVKTNRFAGFFAVVMLLGGAPCALVIASLVPLVAGLGAGTSSGGNAFGLMMVFVWAYGLALVSCAAGVVYFGFTALRNRALPRGWHRFAIACSVGVVAIPVIFSLSQ